MGQQTGPPTQIPNPPPPTEAESLGSARRRQTNKWILGGFGCLVLVLLGLVGLGALISPSTSSRSSKASPRPSIAAEPSPTLAAPVPTNRQPAPMPPVPVLTVTITNSVYGAASASTSPGASCTAQAVLPSARVSTAAGLQTTQTAGADGSVSWSYRTTANTTKGTGTHTVTCQLNGASVSASAPFTVS
jgi:cytoskeletal protein RodZ